MGAFVGLFCAASVAQLPRLTLNLRNHSYLLSFLWLVLVICELDKSFDKELIWQVLLLRWGLLCLAGLLILRQYHTLTLLGAKLKPLSPT